MNKQVSQYKQIRNLCREKYGSQWWNVSAEIKKARKNEAREILKQNLEMASATVPTYDDLLNIDRRLKIVEHTQCILAAQYFGCPNLWTLGCCCATV